LYEHRIEKAIEGISVQLASIEDLIEMKTGTGRPRDAQDVLALQELLQVRKDRR
jgi:predicted nucleotidyltransferase